MGFFSSPDSKSNVAEASSSRFMDRGIVRIREMGDVVTVGSRPQRILCVRPRGRFDLVYREV